MAARMTNTGREGSAMLELRPLEDRELSLVERWLHKEHVRRWYEIPHMGVSLDDWMEELRGRRGEFHWLTHLLVLHQGRPIGLCQYYNCADSDEDFGEMPVEGAYGIDYLIGEEAYLGKGLGREMITLLVERIFSLPDARSVTADIDQANKASEGALLSCGFQCLDPRRGRYIRYREDGVRRG